jgi:riboflavin synthase alpha subunit
MSTASAASAPSSPTATARASGWTSRPSSLCTREGIARRDGVSLTIAAIDESGVAIALVPHTLRETTLSALEPGDGVNLEADVLAKYVERLVHR